MKKIILIVKVLVLLFLATGAKAQVSNGEQLFWVNDGATSGINTYDIATGTWGQPYQFVQGNDYSLGVNVRDVAYSDAANLYYVISDIGGFNNKGTLLSFNPTSKSFTKLLDFGGNNGSSPAMLTLADGILYGLTSAGGANGKGIFFSYNITSKQFTNLMDLSIDLNGSAYSRFWKSSTGVFYASITNSYTNEASAIIQFNLQSKNSNLYPIPALGSDEMTFGASLIENAGNFYYMIGPPAIDDGYIHLKSWRPGSPAVELYAFAYDASSIGPGVGLALLNNTLVGSYQSPTGNANQIWEFDLSAKKLTPQRILDGPVTQAFSSNGYVYGLTTNSTLVQYDVATHTIKSKRTLQISASGNFPKVGLTVSSRFYCFDSTEFKLWIESIGWFQPGLDPANEYVDRGGYNPDSKLLQGYNGKFYGLTSYGGSYKRGVLYEFDPVVNKYTVKINIPEKFYYSLKTISADGRFIYGTINNIAQDSILIKYDISTNTFNNMWRYSPPDQSLTGNYAPKNSNWIKTPSSTGDVLYWVANFNADSRRWVLESYNVVTGVRTTNVPTGLMGVPSVYTTEKTSVSTAKQIDSLYRTVAGVNPQLTVSNGKIYISTYRYKRNFTSDGIVTVPLGNLLSVFDPATGSFSTAIPNLSDYNNGSPALADVNGALYAQVAGDPLAVTGQRKPGLYQVNLTAKSLTAVWNADTLSRYQFSPPVAGNRTAWSAAFDYSTGDSNLVKYDQTANRSTAIFFGDDRFQNAPALLWIPAFPTNIAVAANSITSSGFTATWAAVGGAVGYAVDVSTDNFSTIVAGYEAKAVTTTSLAISGLQPNTAYQVRVRAVAQQTRSLPSSTVTATTLKQPQTITWATVTAQTVGGTLALNATASSGLAVTYTTTTAAKLSIAGNQATLNAAGPASITASQAGNTTYSTATPITQTFCINPATPTVNVTGNNTATPSLRSSASIGNQWYLNGTALTNAIGQTYNVLVSGTYTVKALVEGCASAASANQIITVVVAKVEPTLTWANPAAIVYGTPLGSAQLNATANVAGTFAYSPVSGTLLNAGADQTLSVVFIPTDQTTYKAVQKSVTLTVSKAVPVLQWATPTNVPVGTVLGNDQLNAAANGVNGASLNGTFTYQPASGTVLTTAGSVTLRANFAPDDAQNYQNATAQVTLTVDRLTPTLTWPAPATIAYGTPLGDAQLNATANVDGTFAYTPAKGTVLNVGTTTLQTTFTPTDGTNYTTASASTTVEVTKASQTIAFAAIAPKTLGDADFAVQATASSGLPVAFEYPADKLTLTDNTVKLLGAGFVTLTAKQPGNANYTAANPVSKSFCVAPAKPTITLSNSGSDKITLTSSALVGNQWYVNETLITNATGTTLAVAAPGVYKVQATVDVCSSAFSDNQAVVVTGDVQGSTLGVHLFPNPVNNELTVRFPSDGTVTTITIYDVAGRLVASQTVQGKEAQFIVNNYPIGLYVIKVQQAQGISTLRFEKK